MHAVGTGSQWDTAPPLWAYPDEGRARRDDRSRRRCREKFVMILKRRTGQRTAVYPSLT